MGKSTDELKQQVDESRESATRHVANIEQQVKATADTAQQKISDTTDALKEKLDWRQQVEERPLMAVGAALLGGMVLGGIMGGDDQHSSYPGTAAAAGTSTQGRSSGLSQSVRRAAKDSGLEETISSLATSAFSSLNDRMRQSAADRFPQASQGQSSTAASAD